MDTEGGMRTGTEELQKYRKLEVSGWLVMSNQGDMEIWTGFRKGSRSELWSWRVLALNDN